jgi:glycosyltransferase involved in cell wall biosynthesis
MIDNKLTLVIPAFNEEGAIRRVIDDVYAECGDILHEVIVVDDASSDRTADEVKTTPARLLSHPRNRGYGASLKTGIKAAQTECILVMDADGQHKARYIPEIWKCASRCDMAVGQRMSLLHSPLWRMPGKWILGMLANYLSKQKIPDLNSGFRLFKRSIVMKYLHLCPSGFSFSTTITMAFLTRGHVVTYIPIETEQRVGKSTVRVSTGFEILVLIIRLATLFDPLRVFLPASLFIGFCGLVWGVPYALMGFGVSVGSELLIVTAILLFGLGLLCDQISQFRLERYE